MKETPSQKVHRWITKLLLGKAHSKVHQAIDRPYKFLGRKHRVLFHDPISAALTAAIASKEKNAAFAGLLHALTDEACSRNGRAKELLEFFANNRVRKRMHACMLPKEKGWTDLMAKRKRKSIRVTLVIPRDVLEDMKRAR